MVTPLSLSSIGCGEIGRLFNIFLFYCSNLKCQPTLDSWDLGFGKIASYHFFVTIELEERGLIHLLFLEFMLINFIFK